MLRSTNKKLETVAATTALLLCLGLPATGATAAELWSDGFETYPEGPLAGLGGWEAWDDDPDAAGFNVTSDRAHGGEKALEIDSFDDCVHQFSGRESGRVDYTAWMYVPDEMDDTQSFGLLNTYPADETRDWSLRLDIDGGSTTLADRDSANELPLVKGAWAEIRIEIDLDADEQSVFYNDEHLVTKTWSGGVEPGGAISFAAIHARGAGSAHAVAYDSLAIDVDVACPADLDGDGMVSFGDLLMLLTAWGPCEDCPADLDGDGMVSFGDLLMVLNAWGACGA